MKSVTPTIAQLKAQVKKEALAPKASTPIGQLSILKMADDKKQAKMQKNIKNREYNAKVKEST